MAVFAANPVDTNEVSIIAATSGKRNRITYLYVNNDHATDRVTCSILDGTGGTARMTFNLLPGHGALLTPGGANYTSFPPTWFTAGNAIVCKLSAAGSYRLWGEAVVEP